jgi:hypothetical protein
VSWRAITTIVLRCDGDGCDHDIAIEARNVTAARRIAIGRGWSWRLRPRVTRSGPCADLDFCPACAGRDTTTNGRTPS